MGGSVDRTQSRINDVIRRVHEALIAAETCDELEAAVCRAFAESEPYVFAWIGAHDPETDRVVPSATAGRGAAYLDEITISLDDPAEASGPTASALRTGTAQIMQRIRDDPDYGPWREQALSYGFESSAAIPLTYEGTSYGVLNLYADRRAAFDDRELDLLERLGDDVAHALYRIDVRDRQQRAERIIDNLPVGVYRARRGPDWTFADANEALATIFEADSPDSMIGHPIEDLFRESEDLIALEEDLREQSVVRDREFPHVTHDGEELWGSVTAMLREDEEGFYVDGIVEDVTDRIVRERELRRTRRAVEAAAQAIYITAPDGTIEYVNPAFEEITGYDAATAVGKTPAILNSGEMDDEYFESLWDTILAGDTWEEEIVNATSDGERYHAHQTIAPVPVDGAVDAFVAIQTDISEQKAVESQRRRFEEAIESSIDLLAAVDEDDRYLFANEAYREYHDLAGEAVRGRPLASVIGEAESTAVEPVLDRVRAGESVQAETTRTHPDLGPRVLDVLYSPLRDENGDIKGVTASMRDVSDRKEDARRLSTLIDNLPGVVYRCRNEPGWPMEFVGGRCEQLTGYQAGQFERGEVTWGADVMHPADRDRVARAVEGAVGADDHFEVTYRIETARDELRWVWEQGKQVAPVTASEPMLEGVVMDVTDRIQRQKQLRKIDRLLRHNLRNDLTVIQGMAERIRAEGTEDSRAAAAKILETSHSLLDRMDKQRQIVRLLGEDAVLQDIELRSILRELAESLEQDFPAANLELRCPETAIVRGTVNLSIALEELVGNAIEHNDRTPATVRIDVRAEADSVTVRVADDGPGLPDVELDVMRGDVEETPLHHGQGLGLWLVQVIVRRSGGSIAFADNDPRGTVVSVSLEPGSQ